MFPYLAVLSIPALLALQFRYRLSAMTWFLVFSLFAIFMGLRHEVGPDWLQYNSLHRMHGLRDPLSLLFDTEPFSHLLFWFSEQIGQGIYSTNFVAAIITLFGTFAFALRTANPWLAVVSATPYFLFVAGMSGIRQAMAAGVLLFLLSRWERYSFGRRLGYIFIAALFHTSALVNTIFLVTQMRISIWYKLGVSGLIALTTFFIGSELDTFSYNMTAYQTRYIENAYGMQSLGSLYHVTFVALPALVALMYRREIRPYLHNQSLFAFGAAASLLLLPLNFLSSTMASRLTMYLYFVPMMVLPALTLIRNGRAQKSLTLYVVVYNLLILIIWFTYSNHHSSYIPYNNVLF